MIYVALAIILVALLYFVFWYIRRTECPECRLTEDWYDWQPADSNPSEAGLYQREYASDELNVFESDCDYWNGKEWHFTSPFGGISVAKRRWRIV